LELEDQLHAEIISLCSEGDQLVEINKYNEAIEKYIKALNLIPEPKTDWEASMWIYTALGDTCFINGNFVESKGVDVIISDSLIR
jgi:tetratricopeptide (TPR) repeat protein